MRTSLPLLCAAALAALSCSDEGAESPRPSSVEPSSGPSSSSTPVTIRGDGFLALPSEQQSGGGAIIDARHRAWLDDVELLAVTWIDTHTLEAIVPAGLPNGKKRLQVENAFGQRGVLVDAFTVGGSASQTPAALLVALAVQGNPTTVLVGQPLNLTLTVTDTGQESANVTTVTPSVSPAGAATCDLPSPTPPRTVAGLASTTFTWTCTATATGDLTLGASVAGTAATSGAALQADAPGVALSVQLPAALTATVSASRSTANVGQQVTATLTVTNGGSATANLTTITRATSGTATASCTQPAPAPSPVPTGATRTFTWTCTASTAGTLVMTGTASGTDAVSGQPISATPATPATVIVQTPAALSASLAALPTTVNVGQAVNVTLTVQNTGGASAAISSVAPTPATICGAILPAPPQTIAGGTTSTFTWTCSPSSAGTLALDATVSASDANTGAASSPAVAPVNVTVLRPAALTATIGATPATVSVGENVDVTFTVTNGGTATANLTAITPGASAIATCGPVSPAPSPLAAGASRVFTWTCDTTAAGTLSLSATASGTDAVSGQPISATPATPATVLVQTAAVLTAGLGAVPTTTSVNQAVVFTLTLTNSGQAPANVSAVAVPAVTGATCTTPSPLVPQTVAGGASLAFTWSCTPTVAGTLTISPTVTAADANSGADVSPAVTPVAVPVQGLAALTATLRATTATTVPMDTPVALELAVENSGPVPVTVSTVTAVPGAGPISCSTVTPSQPLPSLLLSGTSATFTWSCTPRNARDYAVSATVSATNPPLSVASNSVPITAL